MPGGPSTKRTTRSSIITLTSTEIEAQANTVFDATSAHSFLKKKSLCHATEPYTLNHIISVLLQITQISGSTPLPVITAIRSVVFLLKQHVVDEISEATACQISNTVAQQVTDTVATKLVDHIDQLTSTSKSLTSSLENASKINQVLGECIDLDRDITAAADRITNATDTIYSAIEDCHNSINRLSPSLETTQDQIHLLSSQLSDQADHS
ncbi:hypothetical protein P692DRAFT_20691751, partial [Suillus brevipes Sb2]